MWASGSFDAALASAKKSGRWLLVDVYATWCSPCHEMDREVYSQPKFAAAVRDHFVAIRRDGELAEGEKLAKRYHVVGFPTLLVLNGEGQEVDRIMGSMKLDELTQTLHQFLEGKGTLGTLELEVATRHAMRGDSRAPAELNEIARDPARAPQALLVLGKYYYLRGQKDATRAAEVLKRLMKEYPRSDEAGEAPSSLGLAYYQLGRDGDARATLDGWLSGDKDGGRYNSYAWLCYKNNFDRQRGIEVAKLGLQRDPKNDGLWDTLAELYAAVGNSPEAIRAEERAQSLKPNDEYYVTQARRFAGASDSSGTGSSGTAECHRDNDCTTEPVDCCDCSSGGKQRAVAKKKATAPSEREKRCKDQLCAQVMSNDPSCSKHAVCVSGACVLK